MIALGRCAGTADAPTVTGRRITGERRAPAGRPSQSGHAALALVQRIGLGERRERLVAAAGEGVDVGQVDIAIGEVAQVVAS